MVLFGGQKEAANKDLSLIANRGVNRIKLTYDAPNQNYTFTEGWAYENMVMGRVMPDSVLLPNGKVVILNGANVSEASFDGNVSCTVFTRTGVAWHSKYAAHC